MTRTTEPTLTNIFSPSILAWRERYAAERAAAPAASGTARPRATPRKRATRPQPAQAGLPTAR